jgi:CBS domain-containing protein
MLEHKVGCLPVVYEGKIVGILTESDVMRAYIAEHARARAAPQPTSAAAKV